ncbi:MAG: nucleotidyltransferase [Chitinophagaceae bacterium]|nr:MAG: nucleotidyltransferase [Chitinophagaceae bacterium]
MTVNDLRENNLILLECISGSKAYGLDTPESDTDIKGVFFLPRDRFLGLDYVPQVSNESNDVVFYELGRFVELLLKNNPNLIELLATPEESIVFRHPLLNYFPPELFLSKLCHGSFAGYAMTQVKKARGYNKKVVNPVAEEKKSVIDFCYVTDDHSSQPLSKWLEEQGFQQSLCGLTVIPHTRGLYALYYSPDGIYSGICRDENSNEVSLSSVPAGSQRLTYLFFNQDGYSSYCKEYREYHEWVKNRNESRYLGNKSHGHDYDAKNMMHTIRLLQSALQILQTGKLDIRCSNREELLGIKSGIYTYDQLIEKSTHLMSEIDAALATSELQDKPDEQNCLNALILVRKKLYRIPE